MSRLEKLVEAVEAGDHVAVEIHAKALASAARDVGGMWPGFDVIKAHGGSLDAAKDLHDRLLPGWTTVLGQNAHHEDWSTIVRLTEDGEIAHEYYGWSDDLPARAWLLAILRAYAAQQEPTP